MGLQFSVTSSSLKPLDREKKIKLMKEDAAKKSIVSYAKKSVKDIPALIAAVQEKCGQCEIRHLDRLGALILKYPSKNHIPASSMLTIPGVNSAMENTVMSFDLPTFKPHPIIEDDHKKE